MAEKLTTVAAFSSPQEAYLAKGMLEAQDIPVFLADEHLVSLHWLYSNAIGGVKLQVLESDVEPARELLRGGSQPAGPALDNENGMRGCPGCGHHTSEYVSRQETSLLAALLLGIPGLFARKKLRCAHCGRVWKA